VFLVVQLLSVFTRATLASAVISCCRVSVCSSVTSRCSAEMAKLIIMQTVPHSSPGTQVFWCRKSQQNSNGSPAMEASKCGLCRLSASAVVENWQLSTRSVVSLVQSQVYHTEHPPYLFVARSLWCSTSHGLSVTVDPCCLTGLMFVN